MSGLLHDWVVRAARERPHARAIVGSHGVMTYGQLDSMSDAVAWNLRERGCAPGDRVGVLMPKSARAIASIIGALKAGCAYVPFDPAGPASRTRTMIELCEPRAILVDADGAAAPRRLDELRGLGALDGVSVGWIGEAAARLERGGDFMLTGDEPPGGASVDAGVGPDDLAYILFTSGSTGTPKGVPISHANVAHLVEWAVDYFGLGPNDRLSGHTELTFDLSVFDIYVTFAAGGELHHVPKSATLLAPKLVSFVRDRGLTLWFSVPAQLTYVARFDSLPREGLPALRHVVWCGDVMPVPTLTYWMDRLPSAEYTNLYGPTETTVASSYYRVPRDFDPYASDIPIGRGCAGEDLLILGDDLRPVPEGEVGDIYIRGVGLSRGYWRDPERTAEAFVRDPASPDPDARIYRTGDVGRIDPQGQVRFLGRSDFQIKTAGFRVEPAEVERAVLRHSEVGACAVVPVDTDDFARTVAACAYVPSDGRIVPVGELKAHLAEWLPGYMIPSRWMVMDRLPLNDRGKVDRKEIRRLFSEEALVS